MKDKVAIVTGATSGIGKKTAVMLAKRGVHVMASGRNREAGEALVRAITSDGGRAAFFAADITREVMWKR